ncbi:hypothetical protein [Thalassoglobus polymorphus]|uniref:Uncharacterized protein n=1 Tax=Thalassoglobus polymorphus TaxID=2527994 RepID=A0A517QJ88_9PLAN|nr:hypothetical protein [Thalassoglobus polymorphus]QDT31713.1 hypothetical protein Mal48_09480 [Thalassoglobus polymorphus]
MNMEDEQEQQRPVAINQTAIALIRRWFEDQSKWLVLHDETVDHHRLIEAQRLEEESFRESIDREIAWQLNLERGKDYIVSSAPRLHLEIPIEIAHGCSDKQEVRVDVVEFYLVELYGSSAQKSLDKNSSVQWLNARQFLAEGSNTEILSRQRQILQLADILNEDESDGDLREEMH